MGNKTTILILLSTIISINTPAFEIKYYEDQENIYTHEAALNILYSKQSKWKLSVIKEHLEEAAIVYAQCGVKLKINSSKNFDGTSEETYFDLEGYDSPTDKRPKNSALNIAKKLAKNNEINLFFIQRFDQTYSSISATSVPKERVTQRDQVPVLNSVWLTWTTQYDRQFSPKDGGYPYGYNMLAHELGHLFLDASHVNDHTIHNLMHESFYQLNGRLTKKQCKKIKRSSLLKKIRVGNKSCKNIISPLRAQINFLNTEKDCHKVSDLISKIDNYQDVLSDLAPAHGIDFYITGRSDNIFYNDNYQFEGPLVLTYDPFGRNPLIQKQTDAIWIHELGHAIFNEQLSLDWPWYAKKMELNRKWNQAVRNNDSDETRELLDKIASLPNNSSYEFFLGPYHELFADVLSAVYFEDPEIMTYALADPQNISDRDDLRTRSFSKVISLHHHNDDGVHSSLAPSRKKLWDVIQYKLNRSWPKHKIVRYVYNIIKDEVISLSKRSDLKRLTDLNLNNSLLKRLKRP